MSQEFCVLKCYSCDTYQVHIVKKSSKKWNCKMCGEKQTVIKVFGQGLAKDCREHVQKLNMIKGMSITQPIENESCDGKQNYDGKNPIFKRGTSEKQSPGDDKNTKASTSNEIPEAKFSKWTYFLDSDTE